MRLWFSLLMVGLGCSTSQVGGSVDAPELTVIVGADRSSVATGQQLQITVTVTNSSTASRTLQFSSACLTTYEFLDGRGAVVGTAQRMCAQVLTQRSLAPGAAFTDAHTWARGPLELNQLGPGTYQIRGVLLALGDTVRSSPVPLVIP